MIRKTIGMLIALVAITPAFADVTAVCKLAGDKRTVTVAFTNPSSETMACETSCDMTVPNGFGTVSCSKQIPGGAKDLVLCAEVKKNGVEYSRVRGVETNCRDVNAAPSPVEPNHDNDTDDDAQRLQNEAQEILKQTRRNDFYERRDARDAICMKAIIVPRMSDVHARKIESYAIMSQNGTKTIHIAFIDGAKELRCCNLAHEEEIGIWNVVTF